MEEDFQQGWEGGSSAAIIVEFGEIWSHLGSTFIYLTTGNQLHPLIMWYSSLDVII